MSTVSTVASAPPPGRPPNRLAAEKSPYLLQHQFNPVDWYPWGQEAFEAARRQRKPIFLSIGYSTCHWCHVMERESFENRLVAEFLNRHFISVKVDREERPDVDRIYMTFVQAMTGSGGWPLNVFLTPELKPFYGGTYWPPESRHGRPSFLLVLQQVHRTWQQRQEQVLASAAQIHQRLRDIVARQPPEAPALSRDTLAQAGARLKQGYDPVHGGWGTAPKFPSPSHLAFLLRFGTRWGDPEAVRMVLHTAERMAAGGIHDQLGGGFARYSVDEQWRVPHFEKMLYDNAQLLQLYLDCYLGSREARYADTARGIIGYVLRDLTHPQGGFFSAEDADSEGKEGKFYCWTRDELAALLTPEEFRLAERVFGVTQAGNFVDHSDPDPLPHQNVLSLVHPPATEAEAALLASAKAKLFAARCRRVRPLRDQKVLASWNGLMLGALARASAALDDAGCRAAAERNLAFLQTKLWDPATRTLHHRWCDGERDRAQLLEAYAFLLAGVLELYQVTLQPAHLQFALDLAEAMLQRFYDPVDGGFWQTPADATDLILRMKEDHDGAEPSGNAVAILALLKLGAITGRDDFRQAAAKSLRLFADHLQHLPQIVPHLLLALDFWLEEPRRLVVVGDPAAEQTRQLLHAAHAVYQPAKVVLGSAGPVDPTARAMTAQDGQPTAWLCTGTACLPPTRDPAQVKQWLQA